MNGELDPHDIGRQLGHESVDHVVTKVEAYCSHEARRIELANRATILSLKAEYWLCLGREGDLKERLRHAPPPGDLRSRRRKAFYFWTMTAFLVGAGFAFALLSFAPFRLGKISYLYCFGIGVITPFLVEQVLETWDAKRWMKWIAAVACLASLGSLVLLAVIRGDLIGQEIKTMTAIVVDDGTPVPVPENTFYENTVGLLRLAMLLLTVAMEIGAGIALHGARRLASDSPEDWNAVRRDLREVQGRLVALVYEITALENEAQIFAERFWRNFYQAMLTHTAKRAMTKLIVLVLAVLVYGVRARAQDGSEWVIALDLTQSEKARGSDEESEFKKNVDAVTKTLGVLPSGAHVTVIGITDRSLVAPSLLLSAQLPADSGYFNERLLAARNQVTQAWTVRSRQLKPRFPYTDIFGALLMASQIFDLVPRANRKVLVIFSDMRHHTRDFDLESSPIAPTVDSLARRNKSFVAILDSVQVYALGADGAGESILYWQSLKEFWVGYFRNAGADLRSYSVLRKLPVSDRQTEVMGTSR